MTIRIVLGQMGIWLRWPACHCRVFAELFAAQVGETPIGYLRRWRLTLARQDLARGDRVETVARRYAYSSPEGFSRAFRKEYGVAPISLRLTAA